MANGGLWLAVCRQPSAHFWDINNKIHGEAVSMFVFIHLLTSSFIIVEKLSSKVCFNENVFNN